MTLQELNVKLTADVARFKRRMESAEESVRNVADRMQGFGQSMTAFATGPILAAGTAAVRSAAKMERLRKGLGSVMGSTSAATVELEKLRDVAQSPGLEFRQAIEGSTTLQAVGFSADEARKALSNMGNALALAGGSSNDLNEVSRALTQIVSKGTVSAEEINQLAERIPQVRTAMQDAFGTADTEAIQKAGIEGKEFVNGLVNELGKLPKAQETVSNQFNNLRQKLQEVATTFGNLLLPAVSDAASFLLDVGNTLNNLSPTVKKTALIITGLVAAIGPLSMAVSGAISGILALKGALVGIGTIVAGISAPVLGTIAAVIGLASVAGFIIDNWKLVELYFEKLITQIQLWWAQAISSIAKKFLAFINGIIQKVSDVKTFFGGEAIEFRLELRGDADEKVNTLKGDMDDVNERLKEAGDFEFDLGFDELIRKAKEFIGLQDVLNANQPTTRSIGTEGTSIAGQETGGDVRSIGEMAQGVSPRTLSDEQLQRLKQQRQEMIAMQQAQTELNNRMRFGAQLVTQFGSGVANAFADAAVEGKNLGTTLMNVFKQLVKQLIASIVKALILATILQFIPGFQGGGFSGAFSSLLGGGSFADLAGLNSRASSGSGSNLVSRRNRQQTVQLSAVKVSDGIIFQSDQNTRKNRSRRVYRTNNLL